MNTKKIKINFIAVLFFTAVSINTYAQVSIGVDEVPAEGALLQLKDKKEITDGFSNSIRGLGMPRVKLTDLNNLYPMFSPGDPEYTGSNKSTQDLVHEGLMVYNVNEDLCTLNPIYKGLYVWEKSKWSYLGEANGSDIILDKDQEGKIFKARKFGDAGIWMLENLSVTTFADGTPIALDGNKATEPRYAYPSETPTGWNIPSTSKNKEGILYNFYAATNNQVHLTNQMQDNASSTPGPDEVESIGIDGPDSKGYHYVQGICPNGWHLPSDREWNMLEKENYNNADKYSTYTTSDLPLDPANPIWNSAWEWGNNTNSYSYRGSSTTKGHAQVMKGLGAPDNSVGCPAIGGGFEAILVGLIDDGLATDHGQTSIFWTSSNYRSARFISGWYREISSSNVKVLRDLGDPYYMFSVRCKKND